MVGVDADVGGNVKRAVGDVMGGEIGVLDERGGRRLREGPAAADGENALLRLDINPPLTDKYRCPPLTGSLVKNANRPHCPPAAVSGCS